MFNRFTPILSYGLTSTMVEPCVGPVTTPMAGNHGARASSEKNVLGNCLARNAKDADSMPIRLDASADHIFRTTTLPTITNFTMMGWFKLITANAAMRMLVLGSSSTDMYFAAGIGDIGTQFDLWNGSLDTAGTSSFVANTWTHVAMTVAGTGAGQFLGYFNGTLEATGAGASLTAQRMEIGSDAAFSIFLNGSIAAVKVWTGVLTAPQIRTEMRCYMPVHVTGLNTWSPFMTQTDLQNYVSGTAWTTAGTLTLDAAGPPIAWSLAPTRMPGRSATVAVAGKAPPPFHRPWRVWRRAA